MNTTENIAIKEDIPQLAQAVGLYHLNNDVVKQSVLDLSSISLALAIDKRVLPINYKNYQYIILSEPRNLALRQWAQQYSQRIALVEECVLSERLNIESQKQKMMQDFAAEASDEEQDEIAEITIKSITQDVNQVIKLVNSTLYDALKSRASDIHLECTHEGLAIKYRIDGVLHAISFCSGVAQAEQAISRIKVMAKLDISERRIPQDGRFKIRVEQNAVDFRVSIMPSLHGEDAVLRILDKSQQQSVDLSTMGFTSNTLQALRQLAKAPHGMVLVTGPTGSGKSTTLYSALSELNDGQRKLITIEDPIEYQLDGILQIPVNEKKGLTFSRGLRAILRHDPDVILVGEIRDGDTAAIAVQAALTGHVVFSSVHSNGVFSVLERFLYMGVEPASLITALNGVLAQRLVRRVCEECSAESAPSVELSQMWGLTAHERLEGNWRSGKGCERCRYTGYHGRLAVAEVLKCSNKLKEALLQRRSAHQLREIAISEGFITISQAALEAARIGLTTLEEVQRVISMD